MATVPDTDRDFRLFAAARLLATLGLQMQSVAIGWQVYEITRRPKALAYIGLMLFLPTAGLSLFTGHVADRVDRRRILLACHAAMVACSAALCVLATRGAPPLAAVYALLLPIGVARAFAGPASQALLPQLVPPERFGKAVALISSIFEGATIVGPSLGGLLYGLRDSAAPVYATSAVLSLLAMLVVAAMRVRSAPRPAQAASWATLVAGVRYVWAQKVLLGAISLDLFAVLLGGAVALMPIFARDILHIGPRGMGLLRSAPSVGAVAVALWLSRRPLKRHTGAVMFACVALFGAATIVFGLSRSFAVSLVALVVIGAADMVSVVTRQTLVQLGTPSEMRGRVSAVNQVFIGASNELGAFESGVTAEWFGAAPAVVIGGVGTCVVVALWAFALFPSLRRVDRIEEPPRAAPAA